MKRELAAHYRTTEPILVRYTSRKIDHSPKTDSAITDFTKSDEYFVKYKRRLIILYFKRVITLVL